MVKQPKTNWDSVSLSADGSVVGIGAVFNCGNGIEAGHASTKTWLLLGHN